MKKNVYKVPTPNVSLKRTLQHNSINKGVQNLENNALTTHTQTTNMYSSSCLNITHKKPLHCRVSNTGQNYVKNTAKTYSLLSSKYCHNTKIQYTRQSTVHTVHTTEQHNTHCKVHTTEQHNTHCKVHTTEQCNSHCKVHATEQYTLQSLSLIHI